MTTLLAYILSLAVLRSNGPPLWKQAETLQTAVLGSNPTRTTAIERKPNNERGWNVKSLNAPTTTANHEELKRKKGMEQRVSKTVLLADRA